MFLVKFLSDKTCLRALSCYSDATRRKGVVLAIGRACCVLQQLKSDGQVWKEGAKEGTVLKYTDKFCLYS